MAKNLFNSIKLSKPKSSNFDFTHDVKLSCNMGKLVPVMLRERSGLLAYLGFKNKGRELSDSLEFTHKFNAIPAIAYYDIFKNYYANKQEENFYTIGVGDVTEVVNPTTST